MARTEREAARSLVRRRTIESLNGVRFLLSAHASHEEFFLFRRLTEELLGDTSTASASCGAIVRNRSQPMPSSRCRRSTRRTSTARASSGSCRARSATTVRDADDINHRALKKAVEEGQVSALYVFEPGPEGLARRRRMDPQGAERGTLPLLIVQGVLMTDAGARR